jgi:hypothetical protein
MPISTAETLVALDLTTTNFPVSMTNPVLSKTPLAVKLTSNSMYSSLPGVAVSQIAILIFASVAPLLQTLIVATVNVAAGQVYNVVSDAAAKSAVPNLPVAILFFSVVFMLRNN